VIGQNQPGILDALLPVQSYPDMVTQTIHVGDCELLEYYMDATDRAKPAGPCTERFPIYRTSRIVAGAPIEGGIYKCALKPVEQAVMDGTYAPWVPSAGQVVTLKTIFPTGVCDCSKPDRARPAWLL
jgi:hypothetical protein